MCTFLKAAEAGVLVSRKDMLKRLYARKDVEEQWRTRNGGARSDTVSVWSCWKSAERLVTLPFLLIEYGYYARFLCEEDSKCTILVIPSISQNKRLKDQEENVKSQSPSQVWRHSRYLFLGRSITWICGCLFLKSAPSRRKTTDFKDCWTTPANLKTEKWVQLGKL